MTIAGRGSKVKVIGQGQGQSQANAVGPTSSLGRSFLVAMDLRLE